MAGLTNIVNASISLQTKGITRRGFGTLMILTYHNAFPELSRTYADLQEVAVDFAVSTPTYRKAAKAFSGENKPVEIKVGRRTRPYSQITDFTVVNTTAGFVQKITFVSPAGVETTVSRANGAAETAGAIATALTVLVDAIAGLTATVTTVTTVHVVTDAPAGTMWFFKDIVGPTYKDMTLNPGSGGIAQDLADVIAEDGDFYAITTDGESEAQINALAAAVEATERILGVRVRDTDIGQVGATDVGSDLLLAQYMRTFSIWSGDGVGNIADRVFGETLPLDPGSTNWAYITATGVVADKLTSSFEAQLDAKNVNHYQLIAGKGVTLYGKMAGGVYIDIVHGRDWLIQRLREAGFEAVSSRPKLPYTDGGAAVLQNKLMAVFAEGIRRGFLANDPAPQLIMPKVLEQSTADRAARHYAGITFSARIAGAINTLDISGTLTP